MDLRAKQWEAVSILDFSSWYFYIHLQMYHSNLAVIAFHENVATLTHIQ
jgi:hypothetical protein